MDKVVKARSPNIVNDDKISSLMSKLEEIQDNGKYPLVAKCLYVNSEKLNSFHGIKSFSTSTLVG